MKPLRVACRIALVAATVVLAAGCANTERSRDLSNPAVAGVTLAQQVCGNCHGVTGSAVSPNFPNLAGQMQPYVVAQLTSFRGHVRRDPAGYEYMWGLSRKLTDAQIESIAGYYARQTLAPQPAEGEAARFDTGKALFEAATTTGGMPGCTTCHGNLAQGQGAFPRLAGQHADYLVKQLLVFQRTDERPEGSIMKTVAHELTRQNIDDMAGYLQALPGRTN